MDMKVLTGKRAEELAGEYPASAFFSDTSIGMDYAEWRKGEMLASAFDMPGFLIFVFSGKVEVSAYREDGSEFVLPSENDIVIGDNKGITDYVKTAYGKDAVLIPYGGDHAVKIEDNTLYAEYPFAHAPYAVTVCRIEPENNIHSILEAFSVSAPLPLVIVGNWDNSEYGKTLKEKYTGCDHIHLLNPIYEGHRINWIRSHAAVYIHGHSAGGTNPSLVEAMCLGLPILAYDCVYNRATTEEQCLYWHTASDIVRLLKEKQNSFATVGETMHDIGLRLYSWRHIAEQYNHLWQN